MARHPGATRTEETQSFQSRDEVSSPLGPELAIIESLPHVQITPWGSRQSFVYCRFTRVH